MKALRAAVSGSRVRYMQNGYDLDLTYITPKLIAMGYPASGVEKTYRNDINEVAAFLNSEHPETYRVFNLSERQYDYSKFDDRVVECGFPDHHPPPLRSLMDIMNAMVEWTNRSEKHVVVVHCLAGKGRTGVICSCYLLLTGHYGNIFKIREKQELREIVNKAIHDFWNTRGQGVRFPSQARYIYYFVRTLRRLREMPAKLPPPKPAKKILLQRIIMNGIPDFEGGCTPFLQVLPAPAQHETPDLLYNSAWDAAGFQTHAADDHGSVAFETSCEIQGDTLIRCFHANTTSIMGKHVALMFHFTFNTDFTHLFRKSSSLYRLPKKEVDEANRSSRFPSSFEIVCVLERVEQESSGDSTDLELPDTEAESSFASKDDSGDSFAQKSRSLEKHTSEPVMVGNGTPMMGWLYKQGGIVKSWKRRWFIARDGRLKYFHDASDPSPIRALDLRNYTVHACEPMEVSYRNKSLNYFKLVPTGRDARVFYLGTPDEHEMAKWISNLGRQSGYSLTANQNMANAPRPPPAALASTFAYPNRRSVDDTSMQKDKNKKRRGELRRMMSEKPDSNGREDDSYVNMQKWNRSRKEDKSDVSLQRPSVKDSMIDEEEDTFPPLDDRNAFTPSTPMAMGLSAQDRATVLHEVEQFQGGIYIYSKDELQEAARLQQYLRERRCRFKGTQIEELRRMVEKRHWSDAEQFLMQAVLHEFPRLVDAMEYDPIAFTEMIAGADIKTDAHATSNGVSC